MFMQIWCNGRLEYGGLKYKCCIRLGVCMVIKYSYLLKALKQTGLWFAHCADVDGLSGNGKT